MLRLTRGYVDLIGGQERLDAAIADFTAALEAHRLTEGIPAPTNHPTVEEIVKRHNGEYEIEEPPEPPQPPELTVRELVSLERGRRISLPLEVAPTGMKAFRIDMTSSSRAAIAQLALESLIRLQAGDTTPIEFRDADNVVRVLAPEQLLEVSAAVHARSQEVTKRSWAVKAANPEPADVADDTLWATD